MRIYKITNLINGKIYIGQTIHSLARRFRSHRNHHKNDMAITRAIRKYGAVNFKIEEVEVCVSQDELNDAECRWIKFYNCLVPNGYNIREGGSNGKPTETTLAKMRGRKFTPQHIENLKKAKQNISEETRRKMSESAKGKVLSAKALANLARYRNLPNQRRAVGEKSGNAKFTASKVLEMREMNAKGEISQKEIAEFFGISCANLNKIINRKLWKHI